ncbi:hypothetical protein Tco_1050870, partial [Tanacetum coccineum]
MTHLSMLFTEADLTKIKKIYSSAYTKLILRVNKLEGISDKGWEGQKTFQ